MTPDLIFLFGFMACTFALGLFIGWALWRYQTEDDGAASQIDFWRKSFDKSRLEHWNLEQKYNALLERQKAVSKTSRSRSAPR